MPPVPNFDAAQFFGRFTDVAPTADSLQPVLEFTLLWNLFERELHDRFVDARKIREVIEVHDNQGRLDSSAFEPHLEFFRERYPDFSQDEILHRRLSPAAHRRSRTAGFDEAVNVRRVLNGELTDGANIIYALMYVAYRVRNNLFHGEKDVRTLHLQDDLFRTVNSYLAIYLEQTLMPHQYRG